jgi:hypothetical protein
LLDTLTALLARSVGAAHGAQKPPDPAPT